MDGFTSVHGAHCSAQLAPLVLVVHDDHGPSHLMPAKARHAPFASKFSREMARGPPCYAMHLCHLSVLQHSCNLTRFFFISYMFSFAFAYNNKIFASQLMLTSNAIRGKNL